MKQLVIFDIDGTLTQTKEVDNRCFVHALTVTLGITHIDTEWKAYGHVTDSGIAAEVFERHLGRPPSRDELDVIRDQFITLLEVELIRDPIMCRQVEGAAAILDELAERADFAISLATWLRSLSRSTRSVHARCTCLAIPVERFLPSLCL